MPYQEFLYFCKYPCNCLPRNLWKHQFYWGNGQFIEVQQSSWERCCILKIILSTLFKQVENLTRFDRKCPSKKLERTFSVSIVLRSPMRIMFSYLLPWRKEKVWRLVSWGYFCRRPASIKNFFICLASLFIMMFSVSKPHFLASSVHRATFQASGVHHVFASSMD